MVALKPVPGDQLYVVAPAAFKVVEVPEQILGELTVTVGFALTVTTAVTVPVHPAEVPVTV